MAHCVAKDGELLGHLLADIVETARTRERISAITGFVLRTTMLRESGLVWLDAILAAIFVKHYGLARFKTIVARPVLTADPGALSASEAATVGSGFDAIVRKSANRQDAVTVFLQAYPAIGTMVRRHVWFRPMLETVAQRRMASSSLGLKLRLTIGAVLSTADMLSDIINIAGLFLAGQTVGAYAMLAMISASLALQILVVVVQNSHRGKRVVAREVLLVLSLLKAGIDAIRVARGDEHIAGCPVDPLTELMVSKCVELVCESIPGALLQMLLLLMYNHWTTAAILSILISCLSTAFTATIVAYDNDTNVAKRKESPAFYG